jgi:hypothetical protein
VGKGKRVDVYLEVRKRRWHIFFEPGSPQTNWTRIVSERGLLKMSA